ncbi:hypothetical protein Rmet_6663 (plasmid) [Cupriavidus metallidurans CH34]|uniref:Uncharacterized protein n=1 Tax=Cupriavidus metallidurans (strain ATCC 43123 / DSM 2839 / NBRC 102507 / CH34) TaxID=266264 RepID=D3DY91_CUPMC|nr:hypothetical protein Rmet_6663 [Cupriavidus metallidurans CH34]
MNPLFILVSLLSAASVAVFL